MMNTEENLLNAKEELSGLKEKEKGGMITDKNTIVEASNGQNAVLIQTPDLTEGLSMDIENLREISNKEESLDNISSTKTTSIEEDLSVISFKGEDKKSKSSSNSVGTEMEPETIQPSKDMEDKKNKGEEMLCDGTTDVCKMNETACPDNQQTEEATESSEGDKDELGSSLVTAPIEETSSGKVGPDVGGNLEENSSMACKEGSHETVELSGKMNDVTSIEDEVQNKNSEFSFVKKVEDICFEKVDNNETSKQESETGMTDIPKKSQNEAGNQNQILENIATADSNLSTTGKDDENPEPKADVSFRKPKESMKRESEDLIPTEALTMEYKHEGVMVVAGEDNIVAEEEDKTETSKHEENSEHSFMQKIEPAKANLGIPLDVASEEIETTSPNEYAETTTNIEEQRLVRSTEEILEESRAGKTLSVDDINTKEIPEEKNLSMVELDEKTRSAEVEYPNKNSNDLYPIHLTLEETVQVGGEKQEVAFISESGDQVHEAFEVPKEEEKHVNETYEASKSPESTILEHTSIEGALNMEVTSTRSEMDIKVQKEEALKDINLKNINEEIEHKEKAFDSMLTSKQEEHEEQRIMQKTAPAKANLGSPLDTASEEIEKTSPNEYDDTITNIEEKQPVGSPEVILGETRKGKTIITDDITKEEIPEAKNLSTVDSDEKTTSAEVEYPNKNSNDLYAMHPPVEETVQVGGEKQEVFMTDLGYQVHEAFEVPKEEEKNVNETYETSKSPESTILEHTSTEGSLNMEVTSTSEMDIKVEKDCQLNSEEELKEINAEKNIKKEREQKEEESDGVLKSQEHFEQNFMQKTEPAEANPGSPLDVASEEIETTCLNEYVETIANMTEQQPVRSHEEIVGETRKGETIIVDDINKKEIPEENNFSTVDLDEKTTSAEVEYPNKSDTDFCAIHPPVEETVHERGEKQDEISMLELGNQVHEAFEVPKEEEKNVNEAYDASKSPESTILEHTSTEGGALNIEMTSTTSETDIKFEKGCELNSEEELKEINAEENIKEAIEHREKVSDSALTSQYEEQSEQNSMQKTEQAKANLGCPLDVASKEIETTSCNDYVETIINIEEQRPEGSPNEILGETRKEIPEEKARITNFSTFDLDEKTTSAEVEYPNKSGTDLCVIHPPVEETVHVRGEKQDEISMLESGNQVHEVYEVPKEEEKNVNETYDASKSPESTILQHTSTEAGALNMEMTSTTSEMDIKVEKGCKMNSEEELKEINAEENIKEEIEHREKVSDNALTSQYEEQSEQNSVQKTEQAKANLGSPLDVACDEIETTSCNDYVETITNIEEKRPVGSPKEILGETRKKIPEEKNLSTVDLDEMTTSAEVEYPNKSDNTLCVTHPPVEETIQVRGEKQDEISTSESGNQGHEAFGVPKEEEKMVNETYEASNSPESTILEHSSTEGAPSMEVTSTNEMGIEAEKGCELNSDKELKEINAEKNIKEEIEQKEKESDSVLTSQYEEQLEQNFMQKTEPAKANPGSSLDVASEEIETTSLNDYVETIANIEEQQPARSLEEVLGETKKGETIIVDDINKKEIPEEKNLSTVDLYEKTTSAEVVYPNESGNDLCVIHPPVAETVHVRGEKQDEISMFESGNQVHEAFEAPKEKEKNVNETYDASKSPESTILEHTSIEGALNMEMTSTASETDIKVEKGCELNSEEELKEIYAEESKNEVIEQKEKASDTELTPKDDEQSGHSFMQKTEPTKGNLESPLDITSEEIETTVPNENAKTITNIEKQRPVGSKKKDILEEENLSTVDLDQKTRSAEVEYLNKNGNDLYVTHPPVEETVQVEGEKQDEVSMAKSEDQVHEAFEVPKEEEKHDNETYEASKSPEATILEHISTEAALNMEVISACKMDIKVEKASELNSDEELKEINAVKNIKEEIEQREKASDTEFQIATKSDDNEKSPIEEEVPVKNSTPLSTGEEEYHHDQEDKNSANSSKEASPELDSGDQSCRTSYETKNINDQIINEETVQVYEDPKITDRGKDTEEEMKNEEHTVTDHLPESTGEHTIKCSQENEMAAKKHKSEMGEELKTTSEGEGTEKQVPEDENRVPDWSTVSTAEELDAESSIEDAMMTKMSKEEVLEILQTANGSANIGILNKEEDSTINNFSACGGEETKNEYSCDKEEEEKEPDTAVLETKHGVQDTEEQIVKNSVRNQSEESFEEKKVRENSQEDETSKGYETAGASTTMKEIAITDLSSSSVGEENVEESLKEDKRNAIRSEKEASHSQIECIKRAFDATHSTEQREAMALKDEAEPNEGLNAESITGSSEEETAQKESNLDLVENSSSALEISKKEIKEEILEKADSKVTVVAEETSLTEAEAEYITQVASSTLVSEEKGLVTSETTETGSNGIDIIAKPAETSNLGENKDIKVPTSRKHGADEAAEKTDPKGKNETSDTLSKPEDQREIAAAETSLDDISEQNLQASSTVSLDEHNLMTPEASETTGEALEKDSTLYGKAETPLVAETTKEDITEKEDESTNPKNDTTMGPIDIEKKRANDDAQAEDQELYKHPEVNSSEVANCIEIGKIETLEDEKSSDTGLEKDKSEYESAVNKAGEGVEACSGCVDTEKAIQEQEDSAKNFEGGSKESVGIEKAPVQLEAGHSHGSEASETKSISTLIEKNIETAEHGQKLRSAPEFMTEDKSNRRFPETNQANIEEESYDDENQTTDSTEEQISGQDIQEGKQKMNEEMEPKSETQDAILTEKMPGEIERAAEIKIIKEQTAEEELTSVKQVPGEIERAAESEIIKEQTAEEECCTRELHMIPVADETVNEVTGLDLTPIQSLEATDSKKIVEVLKSKVAEYLNQESKAPPMTKALEEVNLAIEKPVDVSSSVSEVSKEKIKEESIEDTEKCDDETDIAPTVVTYVTNLGAVQLNDEPVKALDTSLDAESAETTKTAHTSQKNAELDGKNLEETSSMVSQLPIHEHEKADNERITPDNSDANDVEVEETKIPDAIPDSKDQGVKEIHELGTSLTVGETDTHEIEKQIRDVPEALSEPINQSTEAARDGKITVAAVATEVTSLGEVQLNDEQIKALNTSSNAESLETTKTADTRQQETEFDNMKLEETSSMVSQLTTHVHEKADNESIIVEKSNANDVEVEETKIPDDVLESEDQGVKEIREIGTSLTVGDTDTNEIEKQIREVPEALSEPINQGVEAARDDEIIPGQTLQAEKIEEQLQVPSSALLSKEQDNETTTTTKKTEDGSTKKDYTEVDNLKVEGNSGMVSQLPITECESANTIWVEKSNADEIEVKDSKTLDALSESKDQGFEEIPESRASPTTENAETDEIEEEIKEVAEKISDPRYQGVDAVADGETPDHPLSVGKIEEQLQVSSSASFSNKQDYEIRTTIEKIEDESTKKDETEVDKIETEEATDMFEFPTIQHENEDNMSATIGKSDVDEVQVEKAKTCEAISESKVHDAEEIHEIGPSPPVGKAYTDEVEEEIIADPETRFEPNHQGVEAVIDGDITINPTLPTQRKEQLQEPYSALLDEQNCGTTTKVEMIKDEIQLNENVAGSFAPSATAKPCLQNEGPRELEVSSLELKVQKDSQNKAPEEESTAVEEASTGEPQEYIPEIKYAASPMEYDKGPTQCSSQETSKDEDIINSGNSNKDTDNLPPHPTVKEILPGEAGEKCEEASNLESQMTGKVLESVHEIQCPEVPPLSKGTEIIKEQFKIAITELSDGENRSEEITGADEAIKKDTSKEKITEEKQVARNSHSVSPHEETVPKSNQEAELRAEDYTGERTTITSETTRNELEHELLFEESEEASADKNIKEMIPAENRIFEDPCQVSVVSPPEGAKDGKNVEKGPNKLDLEIQCDETNFSNTATEATAPIKEFKSSDIMLVSHEEDRTGDNNKDTVMSKDAAVTDVAVPPPAAEEAPDENFEEVSEPAPKGPTHGTIETYEENKEISSANTHNSESLRDNEKLEHGSLEPAREGSGVIEDLNLTEQEEAVELSTKGNERKLDETNNTTTANEDDETQHQNEKPNVLSHIKDSGMEVSHEKGIMDLTKVHEITKDTHELEKTSLAISHEQIARKAEPSESTEPTNSTSSSDVPLIQEDPTAKAFQNAEVEGLKAGYASGSEPEAKEVEGGEEKRMGEESEETTEKSITIESANISLSDLMQTSTKQTLQMVEQHLTEDRELTGNKEELQAETAEAVQVEAAKTDEEEEGDEHKRADSGYDTPVMVEASSDMDGKIAHKKSHNIFSGVGSKVKHSLAKVKKVITGKSSHPKPSSPKKDDKIAGFRQLKTT